MDLLPAIDLKNGKCVRLLQGDMEKETVFNDNPAAQAFDFSSQGAQWLHLVDLDGAFAGKPVNVDAVEEILRTVKIKTELGGGIRSLETIEKWLACGLTRVILGTIALRNPDFVIQACREFKHRIAVGIDAGIYIQQAISSMLLNDKEGAVDAAKSAYEALKNNK